MLLLRAFSSSSISLISLSELWKKKDKNLLFLSPAFVAWHGYGWLCLSTMIHSLSGQLFGYVPLLAPAAIIFSLLLLSSCWKVGPCIHSLVSQACSACWPSLSLTQFILKTLQQEQEKWHDNRHEKGRWRRKEGKDLGPGHLRQVPRHKPSHGNVFLFWEAWVSGVLHLWPAPKPWHALVGGM